VKPGCTATRERRLLPAALLAIGLGFVPVAPAARGDDPSPDTRPADVLVLRDGRRLEGVLVGESDELVTFRSGGTTRAYARTEVERIDRAPSVAPGGGAAGEKGPAASDAPKAPARDAKKAQREDRRGTALGEAGRAWLAELAAKAGTDDPQVRRSVAAALRALGPAAEPALREAAGRAESAAARSLLLEVADAVAADAKRARGPDARRAPGGDAQEPGDMPTDGGATGPGAAPQPPRPDDAAGRRRALRGAADRLLAELELREEQRVRMQEVLGALERRQGELFRDLRRGTVAPGDAATKVDDVRRATLEDAKAVLDPAQFDVFEDRAQRYFDGLALRLGREGGDAPKPKGDE